jgi:hypothetical protein
MTEHDRDVDPLLVIGWLVIVGTVAFVLWIALGIIM